MKPETISAVRDGFWLAVNGAGTAAADAIAGRDVAGKTGTAQVISNQGKERARGKTDRPARPWLVRVHGAEGQSRSGRRGLRRACRARLLRRTVAKHVIETYFAQRDGRRCRRCRRRRPPRRRRRRAPWRHRRRRRDALMFERRLYHHIDWVLIGAVLAICAIGLAMIYSSTGGAGRVYWTQVYALGLGLMAMGVCVSIDYRSLADKSHWIYLAMMRLLVAVLFFGAVRGGSRRWIDLGSFNLQPSEFAKAVLALMLAKMLGEERRPALTNNDLFIAAALTAVPFLLILRQPDLGTAARCCRSCWWWPTWPACR